MLAPMRRTKIVATIGPASREPEVLEKLIAAGVDVVRLNFSHGTQAAHLEVMKTVREISQRQGRSVALLQDLSGPKIRTGAVEGGSVRLAEGAELTITTDAGVVGSKERISTTYAALPRDVAAGDSILLDDGKLDLCVLATSGSEVRCRVVHGGPLGSNKGMNLPGVALSTPAITEKDRSDLAFGVQNGVDYVALSFVRVATDVIECRRLIQGHGRDLPVIAKIEKREAIDDLPQIIEAADGLMVARGDLGVEMSTEEVPTLQKRMIEMANGAGKLVITATQMLESMVAEPRPTRAEASDVANAILDGTDGIMLSAETASGRYPVRGRRNDGAHRPPHRGKLRLPGPGSDERRSRDARGAGTGPRGRHRGRRAGLRADRQLHGIGRHRPARVRVSPEHAGGRDHLQRAGVP